MAGVAEPPAIKTVFDESVTTGLLLVRLIVTPPAGATEERLTCTLVDWPSGRFVLAGI